MAKIIFTTTEEEAILEYGSSIQEACEEAVRRIQLKHANYKDFQVGYLAINKAGEIGAYAIHPGFTYSLHKAGSNKVYRAASLLEQ